MTADNVIPADLAKHIMAQFAALPPAPMNGADSLDVSPDDYAAVMKKARHEVVISLAGPILFGLGIRSHAFLPNGTFVGRKRGKAVWSNNSIMAALIASGGFDHMPAEIRP